ncbi:MAG: heme ABC exporter ATP-binding protein CcmA [Rhizobiaceae bacterium]|nr:heme ABC exporter ATP-binding protein CcmA [Rhizobiaceae bacterium]MCV0407557.1 heme ABC exporter ATP-binding protein CcmA [Rhizobiaceae bacterium]
MRLIAENLAGERGGEPVFSGISFSLEETGALVVIGENGAGKSTLLRIVAGLLHPASGAVRLEGGGETWPDVAAASHYLGHENAMKPALTVGENLGYWRDFLGEQHLTVDEALDEVGLAGIGHLPFGYLSTGQRRRGAIARMLVSYRPLWLLDEPTSGLDARSARMFSALVNAHLGDGGIVVAATHVDLGLREAAQLELGPVPSPHGAG